ncbi:MAG: hypothetical protein ACYTG4_12920 [Planctomycetota bacterium]|jgi:hypothetical protein
MKTRRAIVALIAVLVTATPVVAQDLRYRTETDVEFGGALGLLASFVPGGGGSVETTTVKGARVRTDQAESSSVIQDVGASRMISLDHDARTFTVFGLEDLSAMMERMGTEMQAGARSAEVPMRDPDTGAQGNVDVRAETDATGERRTINGLEARRVLLTVEFEGQILVPQNQGGSGDMQEAGTVVLLTDMWISESFPEMCALAEARQAAAQELLESARGSAQAMTQLFASNPDLQEAMERQAEELAALDGVTMESVSYMVTVPPGKQFDRDAALAFETESLGSQVAGAAAQSAVDQARQAVGGRLGGLFGGGRREPEPELVQTVLFRTRTRITDVERGSFPGDFFEVPEGYTERPLPTIG